MSAIIINEKNFTKFSKRLQKLLKNHQKEINQLSYLETQELLSQVLGKENLHEMKSLLKEKKTSINFLAVSNQKTLLSEKWDNIFISSLMDEALIHVRKENTQIALDKTLAFRHHAFYLFDNPILTQLNKEILYFNHDNKIVLLNKESVLEQLNQHPMVKQHELISFVQDYLINVLEKIEKKEVFELSKTQSSQFLGEKGLEEIAVKLGITKIQHNNKKEKKMDNLTEKQKAEALGLSSNSSQRVRELLKHDILCTLYKQNPTDESDKLLNEKIETTYKKWYNTDFSEVKNNHILPMLSLGENETNKNQNYKVAAQAVAKELGLNFINISVAYNSKFDTPTYKAAGKKTAKELGLDFIDDKFNTQTYRDAGKETAKELGLDFVDDKFNTQAYRDAGKKTAKELGLNFIYNNEEENDLVYIDVNQDLGFNKYTKNDFVYIDLDATNITRDFLNDPKLKNINQAAASVMVFSNMLQTSPNQVNLMTSLVIEHRAEGVVLSNTYIGLTSDINPNDKLNRPISLVSKVLTTYVEKDKPFSNEEEDARINEQLAAKFPSFKSIQDKIKQGREQDNSNSTLQDKNKNSI